MINKFKRHLLMILSVATIAAPLLVGSVGGASCNNIGTEVGEGASGAATGTQTDICNSGTGTATTDVTTLASKVVNYFSIIVGAIAIIMIIVGGFRYITSGGQSEKVGGAKNTLIYAIIGLVIVALAQLIVHFVLNTASSSVTTTS
jgi:hypothetical protein